MSAISIDEFIKSKQRARDPAVVYADKVYVPVEDYAEKIHKTPECVRAMARAGRIPGAVKDGKYWRIPVSNSPENDRRNEELVRENAMLKERLRMMAAILQGINLEGVNQCTE